MKLLEAKEVKPGLDRLVTRILNMIDDPKPSRSAVIKYLRKLEGTPFMKEVKEKAKKYGNEGYAWASVAKRVSHHFSKSKHKGDSV
jgi:hypothetical protein